MNIIFLGDSITDTGRNTQNGSTTSIGQGYALIASSKLSAEKPGSYHFVNAGISGSRIVDIYARIKSDAWNHNPEIISILAGVNDVWHELSVQDGVDSERFEAVLRMLIEDTRKRFPNAHFILMEPFVLPGSATQLHWDIFHREVRARAAIVRKLASQYQAFFVPLQDLFDQACQMQEASYWLPDGVHPSPAGHYLIADAWLNSFLTLERSLP